MARADSPHSHTPTLVVVDPRGLGVRATGYCRSDAGESPDARISHQSWSPAGHPRHTRDPRLGPDTPNLTCITSLSGQVLLSASVDAGWALQLPNEAGTVQRTWDGRGTSTRLAHDARQRLVEIVETPAAGSATIVERFDYAGAEPALGAHNQCGRLLRHDDPGGSEGFASYALGGEVTQQRRHFLCSLERPDWPQDPADRDRLLEDTEGFTSRYRFGPLGQQLECTDAVGNRRVFSHDPVGQLKRIILFKAAGGPAAPLLSHVRYNALGQLIEETAGNGMLSSARYDPADNRLLALCCRQPDGALLQDLHYRHDPLGNLLTLEDRALPVRHFRNQRIEPINHYRYDSLYQLIEATGWEQDSTEHTLHLPDLQPTPMDPARLRNYRQTYHYDAAGNLTELRHVGARQYTRTLSVAAGSNRAVLDGSAVARAIDNAFDANGNLAWLQPGQALRWNPRNQLDQASLVSRRQETDDHERYVYDGGGQRLRKLHQRLVGGRTVHAEVRYLPGLELHRSDSEADDLQVLFSEGGRTRVQVLHWPGEPPADPGDDQYRYQVCDHLGSSCLELDDTAALLTHEVYYPFGETACWAARTPGNAERKRRRYSGKELDASGLYYYGLRYYAPWQMRWINPDPAGYGDGLNLYRMVANNPLKYRDGQGTNGIATDRQLVPADILIDDALKGADIGSGWFEELRWSADDGAFNTTRSVYSRHMRVVTASAEWTLQEDGSAIAIFQDQNNELRLFVNTFQRHMGIQPGMGLPLFAGRIRQGSEGEILFDNHSGHYKPQANVAAVEALIGQLAPGASNVRYEPIEQSANFTGAVRLSVESPEAYVDLVDRLKGGYQKVIDYLKETSLWEDVRATYSNVAGIRILLDAHDLGISPSEVHKREQAALQPAKPSVSHRPNRLPAPVRQTAVAPRQTSGWKALFKKCAGR